MKNKTRECTICMVFLLAMGIPAELCAQEQNIRFERLSIEDGLSQSTIFSIYQDSKGFMWFGTEDGLNRYDGYDFTIYRKDLEDPHSIKGIVAWSIREDRTGALWVGTDEGLNRFDRATGRFTHYMHDPADPSSLSSNSVLALYEDRTGALWVGTDEGLNRFDRATGHFTHYRHDPADPSSLSHNTVYSIYEDRMGALWVGAHAGLNQLDRETGRFTRYRHIPGDPYSLSDDVIGSIYEDRAGALWVGTEGGGLNRFDRATGRFTHYRHDPADPSSLSHNTVYSIYEDRAGALWVGTDGGGLNRFDRATGRFTHYRHDPADSSSLSHNTVWSIYEDRAGILWVGTDGGGLNRFDRATGRFTHYRHDPADSSSLSDDDILTLYEDRSGTFWVGTYGGGLNRFDRATERFTRYRHDPDNPSSLSNDEVQALYEDRSGTFWVGTYGGGLNRFDRNSERFTHYTEQDGLANNVVYGIVEDSLGFLWLSTNKGLSKFDPKTVTFRNYDVQDGLQSNEFNSGAFHKSRGGEMFFGGINGFNAFYPDRIKDNRYVPPVVLTSFKKFNKEAVLDSALSEISVITLRHTDDIISFEFAALDYMAPEKNQYAYQLEGFSEDWITLGTKRDITFTNLDPGSYTLRIKGSNNDGLWNEAGLAVRLIIVPPFWQTWWFLGLSLLAILGLLMAVYQVRTRSMRARNSMLEDRVRQRTEELATSNKELKRTNEELEAFAYSVSHDLRAPLRAIDGFAEMLAEDYAEALPQQAHAYLQTIQHNAQQMDRLIEDLLTFSRLGRQALNPQRIDVAELTREVFKDLLHHEDEQRRVELTVGAMPAYQADPVLLRQVWVNLLSNALKFTRGRESARIEVGSMDEQGEVVYFVKDNGVGFDMAYADKLFGVFERLHLSEEYEGTGVGLALVQRIIRRHGGRVWAEAALDEGATFYFTLR